MDFMLSYILLLPYNFIVTLLFFPFILMLTVLQYYVYGLRAWNKEVLVLVLVLVLKVCLELSLAYMSELFWVTYFLTKAGDIVTKKHKKTWTKQIIWVIYHVKLFDTGKWYHRAMMRQSMNPWSPPFPFVIMYVCSGT